MSKKYEIINHSEKNPFNKKHTEERQVIEPEMFYREKFINMTDKDLKEMILLNADW